MVSVLVRSSTPLPLKKIKANYRQDFPSGSRTLGDFLLYRVQCCMDSIKGVNQEIELTHYFVSTSIAVTS